MRINLYVSTASSWFHSIPVNMFTGMEWKIGTPLTVLSKLDWDKPILIRSDYLIEYEKPTQYNDSWAIKRVDGFVKLETDIFSDVTGRLDKKDLNLLIVRMDNLDAADSDTSFSIVGRLDTHDLTHSINYDNDIKQIDADTSFKVAGKLNTSDIYQPLKWGYSVNNFLVGGSILAPNLVDPDALTHGVTWDNSDVWHDLDHWDETLIVNAGVIRIVNVINMVTLPDRTPIRFSDLSLSTDLDSFAWVANFTIADSVSLALIKPTGLNVKEIEISINGELFNVFVARTSTSAVANKEGVQRRTKVIAWSNIKLLGYPYTSKSSYTEPSQSTPSGLVASELVGTGFTHTWDTVSWTIPPKVYGYIDKPPLMAIIELAQSVGAVIIPHTEDKSFAVKPYYPISPWDWGTAIPALSLTENSFFTIDTEFSPQESPDSVYVYGEENGGVGVKVVKQGTAGLITMPTIVDKHITDTIAGTERGRIEIAKAGFKEIVPVTTYVDVIGGIIKPQTLIEVTESGGGTWRGMTTSVNVTLKSNGNAIIQSLNIERHYEV